MDREKPSCTKQEIVALLERAKLMDVLTEKAINQAERTHRFSKRDDGKSYLTQHIYPLVLAVYNYFLEKPELRTAIITTLLHDVPEDDSTFKEDRLISEYGKEIALQVMHLQKPKMTKQIRYQQDKHDEHVEFVSRIKTAPHVCKVIKLLDRINNLLCTDVIRNVQKYERFLRDTSELYLPLAQSIDTVLATQIEDEVNRISLELHT